MKVLLVRPDGIGDEILCLPVASALRRLLPEAQIVALAVDFSELLVLKPGKKRITPRDAIEQIRKTEAGKRFAPDFLNRIGKLLFEDPAKSATAA